MNPYQEQVLQRLGWDQLNEIQENAIPFFRENEEALLLAPTGSGKTMAFWLAAFNFIQPNRSGVQCLLIVPGRELALQQEAILRQLGLPFKVNACYGGHSFDIEKRNLSETPTLLLGTPGRLRDHLERGTLQLDSCHTLILDEFDKSLEMGFLEDMAFIYKSMKQVKRKWLTSATQQVHLPPFLNLQNAEKLQFESRVHNRLRYFEVHAKGGKRKGLIQLLNQLPAEYIMLFCNQKDTVDSLVNTLKNEGIQAIAFHGGKEQPRRETALAKYRNGSVDILVATDLAARGLDIPEVKHIIHYDLPDKEATFVHRCGRTARVAENGCIYRIRSADPLPDYIQNDWEVLEPDTNLALKRPAPQWTTLYFSAGRKNKINKVDLVGFLIKIGRLEKDEIGKIEVKDYQSYVAIPVKLKQQVLALCRGEKLKKQKVKIEIAR